MLFCFAEDRSLRLNRFDLLPWLLGFVGALLVVLGVLQYRWTGELYEADRNRMRARLQAQAEQLARDFDREIARAYVWLMLDPMTFRDQDFAGYASRVEQWRRQAADPSLLQDLYLVELPAGAAPVLKRFDPQQATLVTAGVPAALEPLVRRLGEESGAERPTRFFMEGPIHLLDGNVPVLLTPVPAITRLPEGRPTGGARAVGPKGETSSMARPMGGVGYPGAFSLRMSAFSLIVMSASAIQERLLPRLARRHFPSEIDDVAVLVATSGRAQEVIYRSAETKAPWRADASANLLEMRTDELRDEDFPAPFVATGGSAVGRVDVVAPPPRGDGRFRLGRFFGRGGGRERPGALWKIEVMHRAGSVDAVVAAVRRRNLAVSFSVLLLLGGSTVLLALSARRARRLAERQMEFVAAVSHELRTPISVICSAAENLADGIVSEREQVGRYGAMLRDEGRRLAALVEQVLDFAGTYSGQRNYRREPVAVEALVEDAFAACRATLVAAGVRVEREIAAGLPAVMGDRGALGRALRNLIENAVKYGGNDQFLAVRARPAPTAGGTHIRIEVEDHGLGISAEERQHLFEPFFRGREATERQIRGNGLGLALVQSIVAGHGGKVSVTSEPGRGSLFALDLPSSTSGSGTETSGARSEDAHEIAHPAG